MTCAQTGNNEKNQRQISHKSNRMVVKCWPRFSHTTHTHTYTEKNILHKATILSKDIRFNHDEKKKVSFGNALSLLPFNVYTDWIKIKLLKWKSLCWMCRVNNDLKENLNALFDLSKIVEQCSSSSFQFKIADAAIFMIGVQKFLCHILTHTEFSLQSISYRYCSNTHIHTYTHFYTWWGSWYLSMSA